MGSQLPFHHHRICPIKPAAAPLARRQRLKAHGLEEEMTITVGKNEISGQFIGLSPEGVLLLKEKNGFVHQFMSAEIL